MSWLGATQTPTTHPRSSQYLTCKDAMADLVAHALRVSVVVCSTSTTPCGSIKVALESTAHTHAHAAAAATAAAATRRTAHTASILEAALLSVLVSISLL